MSLPQVLGVEGCGEFGRHRGEIAGIRLHATREAVRLACRAGDQVHVIVDTVCPAAAPLS